MNNQYPIKPTTGKPYWNPYIAGVALGVVLFLAVLLTGSGLGASGGLNRLLVQVQDWLTPEHVDQVPYLLKMAGGDKNPLDSWIVFLTLGTVAGGLLSGLLSGRAKLETTKPAHLSSQRRWLMAFIGGAIMGYGARLARGCTSGQALSGGAVMSVGSWGIMLMLFAGAYIFAYALRKMWNGGAR